MAALITVRKSGFAEMAFQGETPWHSLGQRVEKGQSIEVWQKQSGLDFEIHSAPVMFALDGTMLQANGNKVLYRSDTGKALSVVSERYNEVQPAEVLEFFRSYIETAGFDIHTAGSLKGGRTVWVLARTGASAEVVPGDSVRQNLLMATACDGTLATTAMFTNIRVVCANTLGQAIGKGATSGQVVKVSHKTKFDVNNVRSTFENANPAFESFLSDMRALANKTVQEIQAKEILRELFKRPTKLDTEHAVSITGQTGSEMLGQLLQAGAVKPDDGKKEKDHRSVDKILALFNGEGRGAMHDGVHGTAWGLLNAVTEHVDHGRGHNRDTALTSAWFGQGATIKADAVQLLKVL